MNLRRGALIVVLGWLAPAAINGQTCPQPWVLRAASGVSCPSGSNCTTKPSELTHQQLDAWALNGIALCSSVGAYTWPAPGIGYLLSDADGVLSLSAGTPGSQGDTGPAGQAATVTVGSTTTGAPGSSASVTNSGLSSAAVLDFTIPRGDTGATGAQGVAGADGRTVLSGSGAPSAGLGADGDFYLDTAATAIYGPKTSGAWGSGTALVGPQGAAGATGATGLTGATGAQGPAGADGANGSTWLSGSGAPFSGSGTNGDYYFRTATGDVYGKSAGSWSIIANITGPAGATGPSPTGSGNKVLATPSDGSSGTASLRNVVGADLAFVNYAASATSGGPATGVAGLGSVANNLLATSGTSGSTPQGVNGTSTYIFNSTGCLLFGGTTNHFQKLCSSTDSTNNYPLSILTADDAGIGYIKLNDLFFQSGNYNAANAVMRLNATSAELTFGSGGGLEWNSSSTANTSDSSRDAGMSRAEAGVVQVDGATKGDSLGTLKARRFQYVPSSGWTCNAGTKGLTYVASGDGSFCACNGSVWTPTPLSGTCN